MARLDPRLLRRARAARVALVLDALLGVAAALFVLAQAALLARVAARSFDGASLAELSGPLALLAAVVGARAATSWGFEVVGRRAASPDPLAASARARRPAARRPAEPRSTGGQAPSSRRSPSPGSRRSRRLLPATCLRSSSPQSCPSRCSSSSRVIDPTSAGDHAAHPAARARVHVADRPLYRKPYARALAGALAALRRISSTSSAAYRRCARSTGARAQSEQLAAVGDRYRRATMGTLRVAFLSGTVLELAATIGVALVAVTVGVRLVDGDLGFEAGLTVLILAPELYLPLRQLARAVPRERRRRRGRRDAPRPARGAARRHRRQQRPAGDLRTATVIRLERVSFSLPDAAGTRSRRASSSSSRPARPSRSSARAAPARARSPRSSCGSPSRAPAGLTRRRGRPRRAARCRPGASSSPGCRSTRRSCTRPSPTISRSADPDAVEDRVREAAALAGADAFIRELPTATRPSIGDGGRTALGRADAADRARARLSPRRGARDPRRADRQPRSRRAPRRRGRDRAPAAGTAPCC